MSLFYFGSQFWREYVEFKTESHVLVITSKNQQTVGQDYLGTKAEGKLIASWTHDTVLLLLLFQLKTMYFLQHYISV